MLWAPVDDVLEVLRLTAADRDVGRVEGHLGAVSALIDGELEGLDYVDPVPDDVAQLLHDAAVKATVDLYESTRSPGGWLNAGDDTGAVQVSADPLAGVMHLVDQARHRLGGAPGGFG